MVYSMKKTFTTHLFHIFLIIITNCCLFGQIRDTLIVAANPPGNLNAVINADTTASGESAHVYVLNSDTTYFITEEIRTKNLDLIGGITPSGYPPVIAPFICEDGSSPDNIAVATDKGYIHFDGLYLLGTRTDGSQATLQCISTSDSCRLTVENCIIENFGSVGTPNILNTWNALGSDIFVTNCLFRNNQSNVPQSPGVNWAGPGVNAIDTMIVKNSTFFVFGGIIEGAGSSMGYLEFDHNTIFMQTKSSPFSIRQMHNVQITNNIFYSIYSAGLDSFHVYEANLSSANWLCKPAIIQLDSLYSELEGDPYYITEADRNIVATNNAYFWSQAIMNNFDTLNSDPKYQVVGGKIFAPVWAAAGLGAEGILTDRDSWPGIDINTNNYNIDPGFDAALVEAATDSMARFVRHIWENGGYGTSSRPFVYLSEPNNMFAGVPDNWAEVQGYPVRENLRYTNQSLMIAGTDGLPLGDLNWFPEYLVGIDETPKQIPESFNLYQNYPNPFNPTTRIKYSIPQSGFVTIKIFNQLGEEIITLVNQEQRAGEYITDFNASNLASGIYLYRIQTENYSMARKMLLLK